MIDTSKECKAPDCDNNTAPMRRFCSTVCVNVGVEVAAKTFERAQETGTIIKPEDLSNAAVKDIRRRNERNHAQISRQIEGALDDA